MFSYKFLLISSYAKLFMYINTSIFNTGICAQLILRNTNYRTDFFAQWSRRVKLFRKYSFRNEWNHLNDISNFTLGLFNYDWWSLFYIYSDQETTIGILSLVSSSSVKFSLLTTYLYSPFWLAIFFLLLLNTTSCSVYN